MVAMNNYTDRLNKAEWEVRPMQNLDIARALIERHHYARGAANTATYLHGLFQKGEFWEENCKGVAWWMPPTKSAALATHPKNWQGVLCLSRLVIVPGIPKNAATFLLAQSRKLINRHKWECLVTYADEWQGHKGTIYLADNWEYIGKTKPERIYVKNRRMIARKAGPHTRTHAEMTALGCEMIGSYSKHKFIR
jgi:hypothetical protein